jgi:hypothetical protein
MDSSSIRQAAVLTAGDLEAVTLLLTDVHGREAAQDLALLREIPVERITGIIRSSWQCI